MADVIDFTRTFRDSADYKKVMDLRRREMDEGERIAQTVEILERHYAYMTGPDMVRQMQVQVDHLSKDKSESDIEGYPINVIVSRAIETLVNVGSAGEKAIEEFCTRHGEAARATVSKYKDVHKSINEFLGLS